MHPLLLSLVYYAVKQQETFTGGLEDSRIMLITLPDFRCKPKYTSSFTNPSAGILIQKPEVDKGTNLQTVIKVRQAPAFTPLSHASCSSVSIYHTKQKGCKCSGIKLHTLKCLTVFHHNGGNSCRVLFCSLSC